MSEYDDSTEGAVLHTPGLKDPYERFIWDNREKFSALSWGGLLRYGRGIVLMDARAWQDQETQDSDEEAPVQKEAQLGYLPEARIAALSKTAQKKDALGMLRTYNPREEIIVNVLRADGGGSFFQIALKDCPPPAAYRKLIGGDEEFEPQWKEKEPET